MHMRETTCRASFLVIVSSGSTTSPRLGRHAPSPTSCPDQTSGPSRGIAHSLILARISESLKRWYS
jgi:hypothetical protein